jgi:hypothetical protein
MIRHIVDLPVDLNSEDDAGLPWALLDEARDPSVIVEGARIVVGSGNARAVAQVADVDNNTVHVRPLPGRSVETRTYLGLAA